MIKEIDLIVIEPCEEKVKEEKEGTILTPGVGEFLVQKRVLYTMESLKEESQRETHLSLLVCYSREGM